MWERYSVNAHSNYRHSSHYKSENRMAVKVILEFFLTVYLKPTRTSIVLNIEWVQFVLQNCKILLSAQGLYDKNSAA